MISDKEKKSRKIEKELKSLRNKMGSNILWFDSLHIVLKYDFLFAWKAEKHRNKLTQPKKEKIIRYKRVFVPHQGFKRVTEKVEITNYPPNLKYFIQDIKTHPRFRFKTNIIDHRNAAIDILLKNKI
jgi:hypothetical protein